MSPARAAFLLALLVPIHARAEGRPSDAPDPDEPTSGFVELDASFVSVRSAPTLTLYDGAGRHARPIEGLPRNFVPGPGAVFAPTAHVGVVARLAPHLLLPIFGFTVGFAPNNYADVSAPQGTWHGGGLLSYAAIDFVGVGFEQRWGRYSINATVRAGVYGVLVGGTLHQGTSERNAPGGSASGGLRAEVRGCWNESNRLGLCAFAGPTVVEYSGDFHDGETRAFNELFFGLGAVWGGKG